MFWDKPKTTWNKLTYSLVTYWYQPPSIKKILDPPLNIALHFSESAGSTVRIRHCLSRQLASHSSFQYSVNCLSSPSNWPAHLPVKQKYIWPYHGGPQLSRQKQKHHVTVLAWGILFLTWGFWFCLEVFVFCREVFGFAVRHFVFTVRFLVLPWQLWATVLTPL